jgi:hypothetical protein
MAQIVRTSEQYSLWRACRQFHSLVPQHLQSRYSSTVSRGEVNQRLLALSYHDIMLHKIVILMDDILLLENSFEIFLKK